MLKIHFHFDYAEGREDIKTGNEHRKFLLCAVKLEASPRRGWGKKNLKFKSTFLHHFYAHFGRWIWMMFHPMMDWYLRGEMRGKSDHFIYNSRRFWTKPEIFSVPLCISHFYVFLHLFVISVKRKAACKGVGRLVIEVFDFETWRKKKHWKIKVSKFSLKKL